MNELANSINRSAGQSALNSFANKSSRIIYPAIVRDVDDNSGQNRIKAEIVSIDEKGEIKGGKDNNTPLEQLPVCFPILPEFFHVRPQVGECVLLIIENPSDQSSPRYYIGPVRTNQTTLDFQGFKETQSVFDRTTFKSQNINFNTASKNNPTISTIIPQQPEIAVQGKKDADIVFKTREVLLRAGRFKKNTLEANVEHPCQIQLKQVDDAPTTVSTGVFSSLLSSQKNSKFIPYSQMNIVATNINLISTEGMNRDMKSDNDNIEKKTNNDNLERFDELYSQTHPLVYGDELIKLLKVILNFLLNHIHTPQNPAVAPTEDIKTLQSYTSDEKLQKMISKFVRTN